LTDCFIGRDVQVADFVRNFDQVRPIGRSIQIAGFVRNSEQVIQVAGFVRNSDQVIQVAGFVRNFEQVRPIGPSHTDFASRLETRRQRICISFEKYLRNNGSGLASQFEKRRQKSSAGYCSH
jgi:hypothetical protein